MKKKKPLTRGQKVVAFIETYCLIPEGSKVGQPMKLEAFQKKFILDVYDNPHVTTAGYLSIARKNGKTGLIAGILLAHIAGPEAVLNSQIVSGALSRDQAALVFNLAKKMVELSPQLSKLVKIIPSGKRLIGLSKNVEYKALASDGHTSHGLSPVLAILDEVGQVRGPQSDFVDAIVTAQGAYENPLLLVISTQAPNDNDLFSIWLDDAKNSGDPRIVSHVYTAPMDAPLNDEETWRAGNPAMGTFRSIDDLKEKADRALRMPSFESTFRNLFLNQRVEMVSPFISKNIWNLNGEPPDLQNFYKKRCFAALDLSSRNDLTNMELIVQDEEGKWDVLSYFWTPEKGLKERAKQDRAPYDVWAKQGLIKTLEGASIDYQLLAREISDILGEYDVAAIAFDRWRIDLLKSEFTKIGVQLPLVEWGQGFKDMTKGVEALETALLNCNVRHGNNPVLTMCMANVRVEKDAAGNRKFNKSKSTGRIDGAVGLAMAFGVANESIEEEDDIDGMLADPLILR